jgi:phosphoenolpyruvate carboxylase
MYQESGRHADTLDAITRYLDIGIYSEWDEGKKLEFLTRELKGKRPLVPASIEVLCSDCISLATDSTKENLNGWKKEKEKKKKKKKKKKLV